MPFCRAHVDGVNCFKFGPGHYELCTILTDHTGLIEGRTWNRFEGFDLLSNILKSRSNIPISLATITIS